MKERMVRRWESLTAEEVQRIADAAAPEQYAHCGFADGPFMPPDAQELVGKTWTLRFDGMPVCAYTFRSLHELVWTQDGQTHSDYYAAHPSPRAGVYFLQHMIRSSCPPQCRTLIVDTNTSLATLCHARFGNGVEAREVAHTFFFGYLDTGGTAPSARHGFTNELVGRAIEWTYRHDDFHVKHIYSSEYYYTYAMLKGDQCWMASNPADFIKIADNLYVFSFLEERQVGTQAVFLMDLDRMHDVGSFLGINPDRQLECYTVGARGVEASMSTYFESDEGHWR